MQHITTANPNIYWDTNSPYTWNEINEREYLTTLSINLFDKLKPIIPNLKIQIFCSNKDTNVSKPNSKDTTILIFHSNEYSFDVDHLEQDFFLILKTYCTNEQINNKVLPMPLGYINGCEITNDIPFNERKFNYTFIGNLNKNRIELLISLTWFKYIPQAIAYRLLNYKRISNYLVNYCEKKHLKKNAYIKFFNKFKGEMPQSEYSKIISNSIIVICPKGFANTETYRHYESLLAGAIIITEPLPSHFFYDSSSIITIDNWNKLEKVLDDILKDPVKLRTLHIESTKLFENHNSLNSYVEYVLKSAKSNITI